MIFYVTFGIKYATEAHPAFGPDYATVPHYRDPAFRDAHPDNWVEVEADNYEAARQLVVARLGTAWSMMYGADEWDAPGKPHERFFPGRCIARWSCVTTTST